MLRSRVQIPELMKWAGVGLLLVIGLIHLVDAPDQFGDARYKGVLFVVNGAACALAIIGLVRRERWGWWLGAAVALATALGYLWSRTVGLPGLAVDPDIFEPFGVVSVLAEVAFVALAVAVQLRSREAGAAEAAPARGASPQART